MKKCKTKSKKDKKNEKLSKGPSSKKKLYHD